MLETIKTPSTDISYALAYSERSTDMDPLILHDLVALDEASGGFPYRANYINAVQTWSTWQEALDYAKYFPKEKFKLVAVTTSFVTVPDTNYENQK